MSARSNQPVERSNKFRVSISLPRSHRETAEGPTGTPTRRYEAQTFLLTAAAFNSSGGGSSVGGTPSRSSC